MSKTIYVKYLSPVRLKMAPNALNSLKLGTFDFSNISILMSEITFIKYLPPVWHKLVSKLNFLRNYLNLAHLIFQICQS